MDGFLNRRLLYKALLCYQFSGLMLNEKYALNIASGRRLCFFFNMKYALTLFYVSIKASILNYDLQDMRLYLKTYQNAQSDKV